MTSTLAPRQRLDPVVQRFIGEAGSASQALGFGRAVGQIYAYLYFSPDPRNLGDLQEALGISKGSASMSVRQLEQWDAVRQVWVRGDRRDYYEACDSFGRILRNAIVDTVAARMQSASGLIADALRDVDAADPAAPDLFLRTRLERLDAFRARAARTWKNPVLQRLLK
jgi:DNA-binding transcriptional regulator GbsR (MarR family)